MSEANSSSPPTRRFPLGRFYVAIAGCLLAVGVGMRSWRLGEIPALNGDEAWSGVQALRFLAGDDFAWRTPTGNLVNLFFMGPLVALHALFPAGPVVLRSVSWASGLLALVVNFRACRRQFDLPTAIVSTLLLAALPVNIAYSRFAWDTSQTLLVTCWTLYAALECARNPGRRASWIGLGLAFAAAIIVHPTNVFLGPVVVCITARAARDAVRALSPLRRRLVIGGFVTASCCVAAALAWRFRDEIPDLIAARVTPREPVLFAIYFARLLSGLSTYRFISGGDLGSWTSVADACVALVAVGVVAALVARYRRDREWPVAALLVGLALSIAAFYVVAGSFGVTPRFERYALWSIAPITLAASLAWRWCWASAAGRWRTVCAALPLVVSGVLLFSFGELYFRPFREQGGDSHLAFRTAPREPKRAALEYIASQTPESSQALIVSRNWWTRWALEYAVLAEPGRVALVAPDELESLPPWDSERTWFVELAGTDEEREAARFLARAGFAPKRLYARDRAGRPVITVLRGVARGTER